MDNGTTIAETEHFIAWTSDEGGEAAYHIELGGVSLHLVADEWEELVVLIKSADQSS